jgi:hypothetical protein
MYRGIARGGPIDGEEISADCRTIVVPIRFERDFASGKYRYVAGNWIYDGPEQMPRSAAFVP